VPGSRVHPADHRVADGNIARREGGFLTDHLLENGTDWV
jgi:hypothetical protein